MGLSQWSFAVSITAEKCGGILTEPTGTIISPDDDQDGAYDKDIECIWMILADADQVISFKFSQMDIVWNIPCHEGDRIEVICLEQCCLMINYQSFLPLLIDESERILIIDKSKKYY